MYDRVQLHLLITWCSMIHRIWRLIICNDLRINFVICITIGLAQFVYPLLANTRTSSSIRSVKIFKPNRTNLLRILCSTYNYSLPHFWFDIIYFISFLFLLIYFFPRSFASRTNNKHYCAKKIFCECYQVVI